jgi:hypothetical protein
MGGVKKRLLLTTPTTMEVIIMWIKTRGGYLLNLDEVDYVCYENGYMKARYNDSLCTHIICEGDYTDNLMSAINRGTKIMEVR